MLVRHSQVVTFDRHREPPMLTEQYWSIGNRRSVLVVVLLPLARRSRRSADWNVIQIIDKTKLYLTLSFFADFELYSDMRRASRFVRAVSPSDQVVALLEHPRPAATQSHREN